MNISNCFRWNIHQKRILDEIGVGLDRCSLPSDCSGVGFTWVSLLNSSTQPWDHHTFKHSPHRQDLDVLDRCDQISRICGLPPINHSAVIHHKIKFRSMYSVQLVVSATFLWNSIHIQTHARLYFCQTHLSGVELHHLNSGTPRKVHTGFRGLIRTSNFDLQPYISFSFLLVMAFIHPALVPMTPCSGIWRC